MNNKKDYISVLLGLSTAQICQSLGWHGIQRSSQDILTDVLERYMKQVTKTASSYCQQYCRTDPNLSDIALAFNDLSINLNELEDYIHQVEQAPTKYIPPTLSENSPSLLRFGEDDENFPPLVKTITEEHIETPVEIKVKVEEEEGKEPETEVKSNRPNDLLIRCESVESPPYSPLEPKSLNIDAQGFQDMTRPGLKVTTPKGYTPTLTTIPAVVGFTSLTNLVKNEVASPASVHSDHKLSSSNNPLSKSSEEKSKPSKDKFTFHNNEKSSSKAIKLSVKEKRKANTPCLANNNKTKEKEKKKKISMEKAKSSVTISEEKPSTLEKNVVIVKEETPISPIKCVNVISEIKREIPNSPPCLSLAPQIILSSPTAPVDNRKIKSQVNKKTFDVKSEPLTPSTPSRTVIFPPMDPLPLPDKPKVTSPIKQFHSPPTLQPLVLSNPLSKTDIDESASSVLISPIPTEMPVLTFQRHKQSEEVKNVKIKEEPDDMDIDIMSLSQDEDKNGDAKPPKDCPLSSVSPVVVNSDEKRKKKKKKPEKEERKVKLEHKEKKEKKKKREEKDSHFPIPKLTLKMGGSTISEPASKVILHSRPQSTVSKEPKSNSPSLLKTPPVVSSLPPPKSNTKKGKRLVKEKEPSSKSGGFYVETLTNTSSSLGGEVYYCPGCGRPDDGSPMIGCDNCDLWYHWPCVDVTVEPASDAKWYCPKCVDGPPSKKKKKKRKRES